MLASLVLWLETLVAIEPIPHTTDCDGVSTDDKMYFITQLPDASQMQVKLDACDCSEDSARYAAGMLWRIMADKSSLDEDSKAY